jgi:hypothetical protein
MVELDSGDFFPELEAVLRRGWLEPVPALDPMGRDITPIDTDFADIQVLFRDMEQWAREHPAATFLCADDPGTTNGRIPRFGWVGWYVVDGDEQRRFWTITMPNMRDSMRRWTPEAERYLQTAEGRQEMLRQFVRVTMVEHAREAGVSMRAANTVEELADQLERDLSGEKDSHDQAIEALQNRGRRTFWDRLTDE